MLIGGVLFDFGGTLDAPGQSWHTRFERLYAGAGLTLAADVFAAAFGHATRCAYAAPELRHVSLEATVTFHVARQLEHLGLRPDGLAAPIAAQFVADSRRALAANTVLLSRLAQRWPLGVVSNFYGNVDRLLAEAGLAPLLRVTADSTVVGAAKPARALFDYAVERLGAPAEMVLYVGDSFAKDIVGARAAGLRTAWLTEDPTSPCPDPALVDLRIAQLAELEHAGLESPAAAAVA
jgi:putative hydrolase of the HAD superfamily